MLHEIKAYRTSDGEIHSDKAFALKRELTLIFDQDSCVDDVVETLIENDSRVTAILKELASRRPVERVAKCQNPNIKPGCGCRVTGEGGPDERIGFDRPERWVWEPGPPPHPPWRSHAERGTR